jgi:anionic cell wall polymer biosynthesis LytR-Cps2A-Psr (LCP) family protein
VVVVASVALLLFTQRVDAKLSFDSQTQLAVRNALTAPTTANDPYYVLLLGTDSRTPGDYTGRSDTIILARVDPKISQVTLLSIPRDTEVQLEGYGTQKINEAYARGQDRKSTRLNSSHAT